MSFVEPRFIKHINSHPTPNLREEPLSTLIYSQGQYFIYHSNDLNLRELVSLPQTTSNAQDKEEMSPALKELAKKTYLVIKHRVLPNEYQVKGGALARGSQAVNS